MISDPFRRHHYEWYSDYHDKYVRKTTLVCQLCGHTLRINSAFPVGQAELVGNATTIGQSAWKGPCTALQPQYEPFWPRCPQV